jgi:hypothetical protein
MSLRFPRQKLVVSSTRQATGFLFGSTILLLVVFSLTYANHRVIAGSWCGDEGLGMDNAFWNDLAFNDSICRTELQVDTIINLFYDGTPARGQSRSPNYFPKYKASFVDGRASLAKLDSLTSYWANTLDSTDILYFMVQGHGLWGQDSSDPGYHHSYVLDFNDHELTDSLMAAYFNRIDAYKIFTFDPCQSWGNGRSPDSSGFATWLGYNAPESISHKTIILSGAGPQPAWSTMPCDDGFKSGDSIVYIDSLENEWYNGSRYTHAEFSFHMLTSFNGGAEPSEYYSHNGAPGFFFDSIDVSRDSQISVAEAFAWDRHRNSLLGYEDNQMLDLGNLADSMVLWPHIGWLKTTGVQDPRAILLESPSPLLRQTVMSYISFSTWARQQASVTIHDRSGRQVQPTQVQSGVYFYRAKTGPTHKLVLTN